MPEVASLVLKVTAEGAILTAEQLRQLSGNAKQAETSFGDLAMRIAGWTSVANVAVQAGQAAVRMIKDLAVESVQLAASFEKSRMTWGVLVGDMAKGQKVFNELYAFAAKTPLSFEGVNQAATTLKAYGMATDQLIPTMRILGDVAMGDNAKLEGISRAYGQIMSTGRLMGQDLLQLINQGFNPLQIISGQTGESMADLKKRMEAGAVSAQEVAGAFKLATSEGGQFAGMMDHMAESASGKWTTAVDSWNSALARIGEKTLPTLTKALTDFTVLMDRSLDISNAREFSRNPGSFGGDLDSVVRGIGFEYENGGLRPGDFGYSFTSTNAEANYRGKMNLVDTWRTVRAAKEQERLRLASQKAGGVALSAKEAAAAAEAERLRFPWSGQSQDGYTNAFEAAGHNFSYSDYATYLQGLNYRQATWADVPISPGAEWYGPSAFDNQQIANATWAQVPQSAAGDNNLPRVVESDVKNLTDYEKALQGIANSIISLGEQSFVDLFQSLGRAMVEGADGAQTLADSLANIGETILDMMPQLLLQLAVQTAGQVPWYVTAGLVAAAGVTAIASGVVDAGASPTANALGGAYSSPSLHAYANGVYDSPKYFGYEGMRAFAKGGVFGEAGPEAIMPLSRDSSGRLGVKAAGGGSVSIVINNNAAGTEASAQESTGPNGERQIVVTVESIVRSMVPAGKLDSLLARGNVRASGRRL